MVTHVTKTQWNTLGDKQLIIYLVPNTQKLKFKSLGGKCEYKRKKDGKEKGRNHGKRRKEGKRKVGVERHTHRGRKADTFTHSYTYIQRKTAFFGFHS